MKILFFISIFFIAQASYAEADLSEGYDENTEITISGTVVDIVLPNRGPIILKISPGRRVYYVVTAPPWFLLQQEVAFVSGHMIEVKGSKYFGRDGNIYIIGREIRCCQPDKRIILRDKYSRPIWGGHGKHRGHP